MKELAKGDTASSGESQISAKSLPPEPTLSHQALTALRERQKNKADNSKSLLPRGGASYISHEKIMNMRIQKMIGAK